MSNSVNLHVIVLEETMAGSELVLMPMRLYVGAADSTKLESEIPEIMKLPPMPLQGADLVFDLRTETGKVAIAVILPKDNGAGFGLKFERPGLVELPLNAGDAGSFLKKQDVLANGKWATAEFDASDISPDGFKAKRLAKKVKTTKDLYNNNYESARIPFVLNVIDTKLDFSPEALPDPPFHISEAAKSETCDNNGNTIVRILTHGGPHPPTSAFLIAAV